ncbi:putative G-protein coupled receptor 156 [Fundulus diaphanus]
MATAASVLSKEQLLCPICLDVFNQPVSTPCGHNFCRDCIQRYWQSISVPQCPMCKHKLFKRPDLKVNTFISEVAAQFKEHVEMKYEDELSRMDQASHTGDVSCDVCVGKRVKALKSCLDCLASFCQTHLEPHHVLGTLKKHTLINPMMNMRDRLCKKHESLLNLFCHTDQMYVCQVCVGEDHEAHRTVPIERESRDKRAQIGRMNVEVQEGIHGRLQKMCDVGQAVQLSKRNSEKEVEESLHVFNKLLQVVKTGQAEVVEAISAKQRCVSSRASGVITELEQEIDQLTNRSTGLDLLSQTNDDLYLLHSFPAFSAKPSTKDWSEIWVQSAVYVGTVRRALRRTACQLEETIKAESTEEVPRPSVSPVLRAVVWTMLSSGILLALCFLLFTLRFKNNRIVKMSSPNLNVLTLCGSVLTCISGFLFAIDEQAPTQAEVSVTVLQARMWTLCIGSTLVFGPILGKTWRLYRVFTQRVPDKRVIIRDIQLIGMVVLLVLLDILVLTTWNLTDPVRCSQSLRAVAQATERDTSYSLSQLNSCSSEYSNIWVIIIAVQKGCLLLYGTYLAGLTSNVSHPPVNQSPTIITAVTLVTFCSAVAVPVFVFLHAWPNLVYSTVAGAIFICTLATNCMLFVPQLTQWRQFEEDQNNPSQMAKYFSSPSKSQPSVYSQDDIYFLLGENSSMKKLLSEKNAAIDSLQEQVNNAKDKLLRLMTASQHLGAQDVDSSATHLNSSSTQTTELQYEGTSSSCLPQRDTKSRLLLPPTSHNLPPDPSNALMTSSSVRNTMDLHPVSPPFTDNISLRGTLKDVSNSAARDAAESTVREDLNPPLPRTYPGRTAEEAVHFVTSLQSPRRLNPFQAENLFSYGGLSLQMGPNPKLTGFVSSEQLQEIIQELSMDAASETALRAPGQASRASSQPKLNTLSPLSLCSPRSASLFHYPSISPHGMRKRRPPFQTSRRALSPSCFYTGSDVPVCGLKGDTREHQNPDDTRSHVHVSVSDLGRSVEEKEGRDKDEEETMEKCPRCALRSHRCPLSAGQNCAPQRGVEEDGSGRQHHRCIRDSSGYWDSDSSSSTDYCYYHRPYCDSCLGRGSFLCSDSSSDSSDSEFEDYTNLYAPPRPVVFKDDLKPTLV